MNHAADITDPKELRVLDPATIDTASLCEQCGRCGSACPALIRQPNPTSLIRLIQLGLVTEALHSPLIWSCIGCEQCNAACPRKLDVAGAVRRLRRLSAREKDVCFPRIMLDFLTG
ncbi:MAG: 4Fe-4S dicluster domain-containing protein [Peptococcaceae bacterium]|nr:4Fe-4S dicluster domain-containing protein [Peptococcaceae bacterium]